MKKKVFSLMMTLLLAFMGVAKADVVELGDGGTSTDTYLPTYEFYNYSLTQQIYTADEIGMAGTINSFAFQMSGTSGATRNLDVYMVHTTKTAFSGSTDWEVPTAADLVYSGSVTYTVGDWTVVTLSTPFAYNGTDNLCLIVDDNTGSYVSSVSKFVYDANGTQAIRIYSDGTNYTATAPTSYSGTTLSVKNQLQLDITPAAAGSGEITVHDAGATNAYVPVYGYYCDAYLKSEMVYPASELSAMNGGNITSMKFYSSYSSVSWGAANFQVFLAEVGSTSISAFNGPGTVVYEGALSIDANGEMMVNFTTPYTYNGGNLLVGVYNTVTGSYVTCDWYGESVTGASVQGYSYSDLGSISATQRNFLPKTTFAYSTGGSTGPTQVIFAVQDEQTVDTVKVGPRPNGYWMEPFTFQIRNTGAATTINHLDWTPEDYFTLVAPELPVNIARDEDIDVSLNTSASEYSEWQMVALYGNERTAAIWTITAEPYDPRTPDVWELACEEATTFPFVEVPATAHNVTLYDNYTLPFPEIPEGYDAVYKLEFDGDMMLNAEVTSGANGKVAIYTEDFYGEGGPMATNNYTGPSIGGGGGASGPFQAQIGEGTSTTGYFPFYTLYNYSIAENLFLPAELEAAGVTRTPMTSLSWYATNAPGYAQQGITIWMANVEDTELTTTSHITTGMTKVYTGTMTPEIGWNEFVFNEGSFAWDGHSSILIYCQRNNGSWNSTVYWQGTASMPFTCMSYRYQDSGAYDPTVANTMYTATTRPNIIMKGGNREGGDRADRELVTIGGGSTGQVAIPCNFIWAYGENQMILTADEIGTAGNIMSVAYLRHSEGSGSPETRNIDIYMKHITVDSYSSTADWIPVSASDLVFSGNHAFETVGNDFQAIELQTPFAYNGTDNLLICINDKTGSTGTRQYWTTHTTPATRSIRAWGSSAMFDPTQPGTPVGGSSLTGTWVADIQLEITQGGAIGGDFSCGPVIEDMPVEAGTYYLVASSTDEDFEVTINAVDMPCPEVDGFAFNPVPADDEDGVEPASVTLQWSIPAYATGWRLIFGTTYHPEVGHPQTIIYPEDGSFSTELANSYTVRNLWNNTHYFWRVEFNNDGACPDGVSSPVWGFTTHLNVPQNLTVVDETVFNDEQIVLNWSPVVDRTYRKYFIYRDGVKIGETQVNNINATTYTDGPLAYNMGGYTYYVTAVYDEGESAPSNTVNVKVSGYGDVNGHVYEQDGTTGIANATVHMVGQDEFGVNHTYNFTTNNQGYYTGHIYAGEYNGSASCDGYQTINEPVQGNPIDITYNQTTTPIDYILDENFDPVCAVIAEYYPDSLDPESPYVKVYWGCGLPGEEIIEDFETGDFSMFDWQIDPTYPWSITTYNPYEGTYCMKSGGAGVANVVSNMSVTVDIPADGLMSFFGKISCENNWDFGYFYIDGVQKASFSGAGNWVEKTYDITEGTHTFKWSYTKDSSVNSNDDCFYVDYINFYKRPEPALPGMTYDFEDGTMQGWTSVDADGDGYGWYMGSEIMTGQTGNNGSSDFVLSQSYYLGTVLYPDNYLVSPMVQLGGIVRFYACAQDASYAAEHFGLAVSTTNTNPSSFTMVQEWTMTAKGVGSSKDVKLDPTAESRLMGHSREGNTRAQGNWYEFTVDLSAYSGMGYVAIRHFNCSDMFYLNVDDITIGEPGKGVADNTRRFDHYRIYRTNCYQECPYTEDNTVLLATNWPGDTIYIDVEWADLPAGVYKWGVGCVYEGNRGELIEGPISWAAPVAINNQPEVSPEEYARMNGYAPRTEQGNVEPMPVVPGMTRGNTAYACNAYGGSNPTGWISYDIDNPGAGTSLNGSVSVFGGDLAADGYVYATYNDNNWYKIDPLTGSVVANGSLGMFFVDCAYDYTTDVMYGSYSGSLYIWDLATNTTSVVGSMGVQSMQMIACDLNGQLYGIEYSTGNFDAIDKTTGAVTVIGSTGYSPAYVQGGGFDHNTGKLYWAGYTSTGIFCEINPATGAATLLGNNVGEQLSWCVPYTYNPGPTPGPGGDNCNTLALPRESETIWSNCLDKDMYLNNDDVTVNVLLNSADSPEGVQVTFTNYNEYEQQTYGGYEIVLDETGFYAFESFRKGEYNIKVEFEGYEPIEDSVSIWEATDLRYVMTEIIYGVSDLYVSSTGWAMWGANGMPTPGGGGGGGGQGGSGDTFTFGFENGLEGWTSIDADGDGEGWYNSSESEGNHCVLEGTPHGGSHMVNSESYCNCTGALHPNNFLVSPQQYAIGSGSIFSVWASGQDANYAAEHFALCVSTTGTNASDFTIVNEWTISAKGERYDGPRGQRAQGTWREYSVDLSSYAGQNVWLAIRHFNVSDQFILCIDDIELSNGAKSDERHLESFKVMCTSIDGEPIYNANVPADQPFCQLATEDLVPGDHYICKVAAMYSTGMSGWTECEWQYIPCENYAGTVNGVTIEGNTISWDYPGGGPVPPAPGQGDTFSVNFDDSQMPAGWTIIDGGSPAGYGWQLGSTKLGGTGNGHNGSADLILSQSYDNNYGVVYPDNWFISPAVTLGNGSQFSFWACGQDAGYAAEHCGVFVSTTGTNPSDFTMVNEWTLSAKSNGEKAAIRGTRDQGTWRQYTVDLSNYAGAGRYVAIRHFNCSDMFYLDVDDIELTNGAKGGRAAWDLMMTFTAPEGGHYGVAYDGNNFYTSNWGYSGAANNFYKYDLQGNMLEGFNISGCGTLRGITYDGTYFYGVANASTVYCVDLANHSVVSTFSSAYGAMRGITYDPERDGFWVIGNWSGNLTLIDRTGAIVTTGPAPESASDLAYYKDADGVEHVYCFNNATNGVIDWVIGSTTMGSQVFNFSNVPGYDSGSSGGCTVASFNNKIAFIGDLQQSPNLIAVYELRDDDTPAPGPTPTGDVLGAMIFADGEWEAFVEYPTNEYVYEGDAEEVCVRIVYNGTNNLPEGNIYFSMSCPECEPFTPGTVTCEMPYAINIEPANNNMSLKVWWGEEPAAPVSEWLYYDDGTYATSVGAGGTLYWGTMFPAASLAPYAGTSLTKVALHTSYAGSATLNVYVGGAQPGGSPAATQTFTMAGDAEFMEIDVNTPVAIDGTQNLWITFYQSGVTYPADACNDTGDANNRWVSIDGASWMDLATAGLPGYGWMIRGFVTNQAKGGVIASLPEFKGNVGGELSHSEVVSKPADLSFMNRAVLVKYNVYRSTDAATGYEYLGSVAEDGSGYYEYVDTPVDGGTYYYQVRAEYDNNCESEPALAADGSGNNYVSGTTIGDGMDELDGNVNLYPNPTKGNVTIEANGMSRITVVSVLGQVVYDKVIGADTYTLNMSQFNAGVYMVNVYTENGVTVKRVTVMQ